MTNEKPYHTDFFYNDYLCCLLLKYFNSLDIYSSTLSNSSRTYCRNAPCQNETDYYYEAVPLRVSTTGYYTIISNSTLNTYGYIYSNNFNPFNTTSNLLQENNNDGGSDQFLLNMTLLSSVQYIVVVTAIYMPNVSGSFFIVVNGPGSVRFSQTGVAYSCK